MKRRIIITLSLCGVIICAILTVFFVQNKRSLNLPSVPTGENEAGDNRGFNNETVGKEQPDTEFENLKKTSMPLTDEEHATIRQQSALLRELSETPMSEKTADHVAEAFVRCLRLEDTAEQPYVDSVRYEKSAENSWEFWIVSSSAGVQYWMWGFTINGSFSVLYVYKDDPGGEHLLGYYDD